MSTTGSPEWREHWTSIMVGRSIMRQSRKLLMEYTDLWWSYDQSSWPPTMWTVRSEALIGHKNWCSYDHKCALMRVTSPSIFAFSVYDVPPRENISLADPQFVERTSIACINGFRYLCMKKLKSMRLKYPDNEFKHLSKLILGKDKILEEAYNKLIERLSEK